MSIQETHDSLWITDECTRDFQQSQNSTFSKHRQFIHPSWYSGKVPLFCVLLNIMLLYIQFTPYPLTATIFSTDLPQDREGSLAKHAQKFSYEPDIIDAMMSHSEAQGIEKNTNKLKCSKQDGSHPTPNHISNDLSAVPATDLTNENEAKGRLLAQQSGLVQVMSSRLVTTCIKLFVPELNLVGYIPVHSTISSSYSTGGQYSRCCTVM